MKRARKLATCVCIWLLLGGSAGCDFGLFCNVRMRTVRVGPNQPGAGAELRALRNDGWDCEKVFRSAYEGQSTLYGVYSCSKCG